MVYSACCVGQWLLFRPMQPGVTHHGIECAASAVLLLVTLDAVVRFRL